jgi:release factor glutamine methyltransferase
MNSRTTIETEIDRAARRLSAAGISGARAEARLLAGAALGLAKETLLAFPERTLAPAERARLHDLVRRRASREPVARILGVREFWSLPFRVTADTLIPRPESETVVEAALETIADRNEALEVLDLGTGTGCLLLALLSELPNATGLGIDGSERALDVARANARALGLAPRARFRRGDWGKGLEGGFDLILANPPYIPDARIGKLEPEVAKFEPRLALAGGRDGLECFRAIAAELTRLLVPGGRLVLELGEGQADSVTAILARRRLKVTGLSYDLAGHPRCIVASVCQN